MTNEELVLAIQSGENVTENIEKLYRQNTGLIVKASMRYKGLEDLEDLQQEGYFGLVRAVELWSPEHEVMFSTYAYYWIRLSMYRYVCKCSKLIRIPDYQLTRMQQYHKTFNSFRVLFGRDPRPAEIMTSLGITPEQLRDLESNIRASQIGSISKPILDDSEETLGDFLPDESEPFEDALDRIHRDALARELWGEVDKLPEQEAEVLRSRFCDDMTLNECGDVLGVTAARAKSLQESALRKLRRPRVTRRLSAYLTESGAFSFGLISGYGTFKQTGTSAQERAVIKLEQKTGSIWK